MVFDGHPVEASNNYGTNDDDVACQFLIEFPNDAALEALQNYTCIEYDSPVCNVVDPTESPIGGPTGPPSGSASESTGSGSSPAKWVSLLLTTFASLIVCAFVM